VSTLERLAQIIALLQSKQLLGNQDSSVALAVQKDLCRICRAFL